MCIHVHTNAHTHQYIFCPIPPVVSVTTPSDPMGSLFHIQEERNRLPQAQIDRIIDSMPHRCSTIVNAIYGH